MHMYDIIRSNRKTIAIQINGDGQVIFRAPLWMTEAEVLGFVDKKKTWIKKHLNAIAQRQTAPERPFTAAELHELAVAAKEDIGRRVAKFAPIVGVTFGRITIRAQKSRMPSLQRHTATLISVLGYSSNERNSVCLQPLASTIIGR